MIDAPVNIRGGGPLAITISPVYNTDGRTIDVNGLSTKAKPKKDKIARPPNAFILYRQHHHANVVAQYPQLHNNQICESSHCLNKTPVADSQVAIILGQQWQSEKDVVKAQFKTMAEEIKKKHLNAHPDYQYQPRKPAEKKRRMTRRKAEKMAAAAITDPTAEVVLEATPKFEETTTGNAVFTMGDDLVDEDALFAMIDNHNGDIASTNLPLHATAPALFHETPAEVMDDINFYGNLLDFDNLYQDEYGEEKLDPAEEAAVNAFVAQISPGQQNLTFDQFITQEQNYDLSKFSTLWPSPKPKEATLA
ncbi:MAG: hypothetical protein Q9184_000467 [Pyrenodesmia sp. 2 TL-2023]